MPEDKGKGKGGGNGGGKGGDEKRENFAAMYGWSLSVTWMDRQPRSGPSSRWSKYDSR